MDRRKLIDKRSGFFNAKRTSALDGLLGKLEQQQQGKVNDPQVVDPQVANPQVANPQVANPQVANPQRRSSRKAKNLPTDPLNMKKRMQKARQAQVLRRHQMGTYSTSTNEDEEAEGDLKDLETAKDFVDENKYKTMEWTEPDGSKTTLKFDEDGTLVGKETTKSRPDKFSRDLKKAVDKNAVALKDYEDSLMLDPVPT